MISDYVAICTFLVLGFYLGGYIALKGFKLLRLKWLIENTPTSKLRSIAMGFVEVVGKVSACKNKQVPNAGMLKSPIDGVDCVYYETSVKELCHDSTGKAYWEIVYEDTRSVRFNVKDDTGACLVDHPAGAVLDLPFDVDCGTGIIGTNLPKNCAGFCKKNGLSQGIFSKRKHFTERYLELGDDIYLLGTAMENPFVSSSASNEDHVMIGQGTKGRTIFHMSRCGHDEMLYYLNQSGSRIALVGITISVLCLYGIWKTISWCSSCPVWEILSKSVVISTFCISVIIVLKYGFMKLTQRFFQKTL
jgi:hypothetical protein